MPIQHKDLKSQRISIYFDCICGIICSITAFIGIFYYTKQEGILFPANYAVGLSFWICFLLLSIFMIGLGIYTYYREKKFDPDVRPDKKLKAPILG